MVIMTGIVVVLVGRRAAVDVLLTSRTSVAVVGDDVETDRLTAGRVAAPPAARVYHDAGNVAKGCRICHRGGCGWWWWRGGHVRWRHWRWWRRWSQVFLATAGGVETSFLKGGSVLGGEEQGG